MRYFVVAVCCSCAIFAALAGWGWQRWLSSEISPAEYGSLYALRRMAPEMFTEKLLPELEKAMADKRITQRELRAINARTGNMGPLFLQAVKERSFDEQLSESLRDAERKTRETGRNLGDALGKVLDDAMDYMIRQSEEFAKKFPAEPKEQPESPSAF